MKTSGGKTVEGKLLSHLFVELMQTEQSAANHPRVEARMHHGVDLVILVAASARAAERWQLAQWCERWLTARRPLVDSVATDLGWFAIHPGEALDRAKLSRTTRA